jgi:hypothetical protein
MTHSPNPRIALKSTLGQVTLPRKYVVRHVRQADDLV